MKAAAILQSFTENILQGARIESSVAPSTGYSLETLGYLRPDMRVAFGSLTVTIDFELIGGGSPATAAQGDILVIPFHNFDGTVSLTNDAGMNQAQTIPQPLGNGLPRTLVTDLSILTASSVTRTSDNWHLVIANSVENVVLGGAIAIYSPKTFLLDRDFQFGYALWKQGSAIDAQNEYQTLFRQNLGTMVRGVDLSTIATDDDADILEGQFDECNGHAKPGLLWFDPDIQDAFLGHFQPRFARRYLYADANQIDLSFTELSKGRPLS